MDQDNVNRALQAARERLPPKPKVVAIEAEPYVDTMGEDALRVWIVLDQATTDREIEMAPTLEVRSTVFDTLREYGIDLFPYTSILREQERQTVRGEN